MVNLSKSRDRGHKCQGMDQKVEIIESEERAKGRDEHEGEPLSQLAQQHREPRSPGMAMGGHVFKPQQRSKNFIYQFHPANSWHTLSFEPKLAGTKR